MHGASDTIRPSIPLPKYVFTNPIGERGSGAICIARVQWQHFPFVAIVAQGSFRLLRGAQAASLVYRGPAMYQY